MGRGARLDTANVENLEAGRGLPGETSANIRGRQVGVQLQFGHLAATDNPQGQRQGEDQPRFGVEARSRMEGDFGPPQHALEGAHQVMVANQAKVAGLAESNSDLGTDHEKQTTPGAEPRQAGANQRRSGAVGGRNGVEQPKVVYRDRRMPKRESARPAVGTRASVLRPGPRGE